MRLIPYQDVRAFYERVRPLLLAREVENNLPIGILERGLSAEETDWFMAALTDGAGRDALVALRTPPHNLILASSGEEASAMAVEDVYKRQVQADRGD